MAKITHTLIASETRQVTEWICDFTEKKLHPKALSWMVDLLYGIFWAGDMDLTVLTHRADHDISSVKSLFGINLSYVFGENTFTLWIEIDPSTVHKFVICRNRIAWKTQKVTE